MQLSENAAQYAEFSENVPGEDTVSKHFNPQILSLVKAVTWIIVGSIYGDIVS